MQVRDATLNDVLGLIPLIEQHAAAHGEEDIAEADLIKYVALLISSEAVDVLLVDSKQGEVLGVVVLAYSPRLLIAGEVEAVEKMFEVKEGLPSRQASKVGSLLFRALENAAAEREAREVVVWSRTDQHENRLANTYKQRGYVKTGSFYAKAV